MSSNARTTIGGSLKLIGTFRDFDGVLASPGTVTLKIKAPVAALLTVSPTEDSEGVWSYVYTSAEAGIHWYRFEGTSPIVAVSEDSFVVDASKVIP